MKAFVTSQFSYWPLIWMFHSRKMEKKGKQQQQKRALKLVHEDSHDLILQAMLAKNK